jgi:hypothetical protein
VACDHPVGCGAPPTVPTPCFAASRPGHGSRSRAARGAKGYRYYDWAFLRLDHSRSHGGPAPADQAGQHWLLIRRNQRTGELAFYRC